MLAERDPVPAASLFPDAVERERQEDRLTVALRRARSRMASGAVSPTLDHTRFDEELETFDFAAPQALETVLPWVVEQIEHGVVHMTHPRYFGLFNPAPSFPAECAERIAAAFNPQLATATTSPAAVAIEAHVIAAIAQRAGLPAGTGGHFTTGGSEANFTALLCALVQTEPRFVAEGVRAFSGAPVLYVSSDAHLAWYKLAVQAGIGRDAVRLVGTDGAGRMDPDALAAAIAKDRVAGRVPVMIAATAGTTCAGMVDPIIETARIARETGCWFHVDAAWGGALIASAQARGCLAGIEQAQSVTIDAHKWFATTMGCGMILVRDTRILSRAFQVSTGFMPSNDASRDPYVNSVQWSRRFIGLRLFVSLAVAGWDGFATHVAHATGLAALLARGLAARGWRIVNDPALAVVCAEPPDGFPPVRDIVTETVASGAAWISAARFEQRDVVRACITHGETSCDDIRALVRILDSFRIVANT